MNCRYTHSTIGQRWPAEGAVVNNTWTSTRASLKLLNTYCVKLHMNSIMVDPPGEETNGTSSTVNITDVKGLIIIIMNNLGHIIVWLLSRKQAFIPLSGPSTYLLTGPTDPLRILCIITALCPFLSCWKAPFSATVPFSRVTFSIKGLQAILTVRGSISKSELNDLIHT